MLLGTTGYKIYKMGRGSNRLGWGCDPADDSSLHRISSRSYDWTQRWKTTVKTLRAKNPTTFTERRCARHCTLHF